jgi:hypothetical protein
MEAEAVRSLLMCGVVVLFSGLFSQSTTANEITHRHFTHDWKWREWALRGHANGDTFAAIRARRELKPRFAGTPGMLWTTHHFDRHLLK